MSKAAKKTRELLLKQGVILAPCAYDALSAKLIEYAGFDLIGTTGYGMHAAMLGVPDNGMLAFNEMGDALSKMCDAVSIPIMADAEGGYGNAINTIRTVKVFEKAGLGGLFIEDQKLPPNCPFLKATEMISVDEMCGKIKAAVEAREDPNFVIVARTDAPFEEAVERAAAYVEAGADMIKLIPKNKRELELAPQRVKAPLHLGFIPGKDINAGMTAWDAGKLGYKIVTLPLTPLLLNTKATLDGLRKIKQNGNDDAIAQDLFPIEDFFNFIGKQKFAALEQRYLKK